MTTQPRCPISHIGDAIERCAAQTTGLKAELQQRVVDFKMYGVPGKCEACGGGRPTVCMQGCHKGGVAEGSPWCNQLIGSPTCQCAPSIDRASVITACPLSYHVPQVPYRIMSFRSPIRPCGGMEVKASGAALGEL